MPEMSASVPASGGFVSYDDLTTFNLQSDVVSNRITVGPDVVTNSITAGPLTAESITQRNYSFTISAEDARNHNLARSTLTIDGDEALQEYYADIVNRFERNHPEYFTAQRWNVSTEASCRSNKNEIKELIREVLIEEGIILNKPLKEIETEEVDELFEQRGINDES